MEGVLHLLAQTPTSDKADPELGYNLLIVIMAVGITGMLLMFGLIIIRRLARRWEKSIEQGIAERRANPTPTSDVWRESAERYTDPDALSPEERSAREQGILPEHEEEPEPFPDPTSTATEPDPANEEDEDEDDPFGLFRDKPYQDPVDEDEDEDDAEEDEDKPF